jgi:hypothetical protein
VRLTPTAAYLTASQTQQFTATTNPLNTAVTWSLNPNAGSIDSTGLFTAPAMIASQQTVTVTATSVANSNDNASATVTLFPPTSNAYSYHRAIVIDHTKMPNTDQSNFPVLISGTYSYLATVAHGGNAQHPAGYDIVFTGDEAGTGKLDYEIESYDPYTGTLNAWVRIPALSHTTDTTIYLQYGNGTISASQENKSGVWDSGYQMVLHLEEFTAPYKDSTSNAYSSTGGTYPNSAAGKVGRGQSFDGTTQYIAYSPTQSPSPAGDITLETWIKTTETGSKGIFGKWENDGTGNSHLSYVLTYQNNSQPSAFLNAIDGSLVPVDGGDPVNDGNWHHVAVSAPASGTIQMYIDGVPSGSAENSHTLLATTADRLLVGVGGLADPANYYMQGSLDEVRISNVVRTEDWIAAQYSNQNSPETFYSVGAESAVNVSITPLVSTLSVSQTRQFTATVTGSSNTSVTWALFPNVGSIDSTGLYAAPATIASQQTVTVTAISAADNTRSASATVTLNPTVTVSVTPTTASLSASQTQQFTATVANAGNMAVTWSLSPNSGAIDSTGLYTAPATIANQQTVTVRATSVADNTKIASATVTLNATATVSVTPTAASLAASQTRQFTATVTNASNTAVTWSLNPDVGSIGSTGLYTAPVTITSQQTVTVTATSVADVTKSASATVTLYPVTIDVTPTAVSLFSSRTQRFTAMVTHAGNTAVTWSLSPDVGSIGNTGLYTAPAAIDSQQTVTVTATSVADNTVTASATVTLNPPVSITSLSPTSGAGGVQVTVYGSGFGSVPGTGAVWLGSTYGTVVSWNDSQVAATIAANSRSGTARVRQGGAWSNAVTFDVNTTAISGVSPASGVAGTQVTITGSGFGAVQGSGQVWLGTLNGVVQTWNDTQVVALVASESASGNAQVLQGGVWSNAVPFTVNTLRITSLSAASGSPGTSVTITGTGFGSYPDSGAVLLGSEGIVEAEAQAD